MIGLIEDHNLPTGYRFVIVEYVVVGLLLGLGTWRPGPGQAPILESVSGSWAVFGPLLRSRLLAT